MTSSRLPRLTDPRTGIAVFTAVASALMSAHWLPMAIPSLVVLALVLLAPGTGLRPWPWWCMAAAWLAVLLALPERMEDHVFLFTAWLLALAVSLGRRDEAGFLDSVAWQARILMGVTFTAAVVWKVAFGDFLNGMALWVFAMVDGRFAPLTRLLGLSEADVDDGRASIGALLRGDIDSGLLTVADGHLWRFAVVAVLTVLLEATIAVSHLVPDGNPLAALRIPSVVIFAVTTYAVVPVLGFAFLLALLAAAAARWRTGALVAVPVMILPALVRVLTLP